MTAGISEQRNPYKGEPQRAWLRLILRPKNGVLRELDFLADTGSPCALVLSEAAMAQLTWGKTSTADTNFGPLAGGWLRLTMPELGLDEFMPGYASEEVVASAKQNSPDFEGLVGLPVLRLGEYGGDADSFWFRGRKKPT
ncbi:MAG TPA: hypothetical protein VEL76_12530 [Gemmataceae bacterium]|nr:hypothetical protein [Gemmataceae bacterium]